MVDGNESMTRVAVADFSCPSSVPEVDHPVARRIYLQDGMIPKYTGWVPGEFMILYDYGR